jgi:hypothetical protein
MTSFRLVLGFGAVHHGLGQFVLNSLPNGGSAIDAILGVATIDVVDSARRLYWRRINPAVSLLCFGRRSLPIRNQRSGLANATTSGEVRAVVDEGSVRL